MTTATIKLTIEVTNTTADELHEHAGFLSSYIEEFSVLFEEKLSQVATVKTIEVSDDEAPRIIVGTLV